MLAKLGRFLDHDLWVIDLESLHGVHRFIIQSLRLIVAVVSEFQHRLLDTRAASLVYTTLLSLVPLLAVMFSVLKAFGVHEQIEPVLAQALEPLGEKGEEITRKIIEFVSNIKVGVLGAVGLAALFFTTYSLIDKVEESLNSIWRVKSGRPLTRKFTDYLSVLLVGPVLVFTAFALIATAQSTSFVQRMLEIQALGYVVVWLTQLMPFALFCAFFTFFYRFVPYTKVHVQSALVGGITAAVLWHIAGAAFAGFVAASGRYPAIYSSFAILILFLIWLYLSWLIVLVGAQVSFFHQNPSTYQTQFLWKQGSHAFRERLALTMLRLITRRHLEGGQPCRLGEIGCDLNVPLAVVDELVNEFVWYGLLCRTLEPDGVTLVKSPDLVPLREILDMIRQKDRLEPESPRDAKDPVVHFLKRRDQAVELAVGGVTLHAFALLAEPELTESDSASSLLKEEVT